MKPSEQQRPPKQPTPAGRCIRRWGHTNGFFELSQDRSPARLHGLLGFTLVELLAIVSVLGIMGIALASSMANTRPSTAGLVCMNNLHQLGSAWKMYADDSGGKLVYNTDGTQSGKSASFPSWVGGWLDYSSGTDNTNTALLVNHNLYPYAAYLGPYLKDPSVFKCPADGSFANIAGHSYHRVRSYSMNNTFGPDSRMWTVPSLFTHHLTLTDVKHPSQLFIITEEHNGSINDGCFFSDPDTLWQIIDFPAAYHNSGCNFVFVDGHTEQHRWISSSTIPVVPPGTLIPLNQNLPGDLDIAWLQQHADERP